jgi:hypothetical protein
VAALERAVALEEVDGAGAVAEDLHLDVTGVATYLSTSTASLPKAPCASRLAEASASAKAAWSSTRRIPLPPPPATALMRTGKPMRAASSARRAGDWSSPW